MTFPVLYFSIFNLTSIDFEMTEINVQNFKEKFPEIKKSLEESKFIAIDLEFSALNPLKEQSPR